jgi:hypothetical protein
LQIYAQLFGFAKYFAKIFFKERMWGSLKSIAIGLRDVAIVRLALTFYCSAKLQQLNRITNACPTTGRDG